MSIVQRHADLPALSALRQTSKALWHAEEPARFSAALARHLAATLPNDDEHARIESRFDAIADRIPNVPCDIVERDAADERVAAVLAPPGASTYRHLRQALLETVARRAHLPPRADVVERDIAEAVLDKVLLHAEELPPPQQVSVLVLVVSAARQLDQADSLNPIPSQASGRLIESITTRALDGPLGRGEIGTWLRPFLAMASQHAERRRDGAATWSRQFDHAGSAQSRTWMVRLLAMLSVPEGDTSGIGAMGLRMAAALPDDQRAALGVRELTALLDGAMETPDADAAAASFRTWLDIIEPGAHRPALVDAATHTLAWLVDEDAGTDRALLFPRIAALVSTVAEPAERLRCVHAATTVATLIEAGTDDEARTNFDQCCDLAMTVQPHLLRDSMDGKQILNGLSRLMGRLKFDDRAGAGWRFRADQGRTSIGALD